MDGSSASLAPLDASVTAVLSHQRRDSLGGSAMSEQERMTRPRGYDVVKRYWALPLYVVLFLLVYAPCIMMTYGYADDYSFLYDVSSGNAQAVFLEVTFGGRPLDALLMLSMGVVGHVSRLWIMRLIAILGIALLAWLLHRALRSVHAHPMVALCAPVIMCTLPALAIYTAWSLAAFWPIASILAGLAVLVLDRDTHHLPRVRTLVVALALQTTATLIYQPAAMMFWVFAAIYLLMEKHRTPRELLRRLLVQGGVVVGALAIDFAFVKALPLVVHYSTPVAGRSGVLQDPIAKAHWFITSPLFDALNLWSLNPTIRIARAVLVFVVVGLLCYFQGPWRDKAIRLAIAGALLPLAMLPNMLVAENENAYRLEDALTALLGLYLVLAIVGYARVLERVLRPSWFAAADWILAHGYARELEARGGDAREYARTLRLSWPTTANWILVRGVAIVLFLLTAASCLSATNTVNSEMVVPNALAYQVIQRGIERANLNRPVAHVYVVRLSCAIDSPSAILNHEYGRATTVVSWGASPMVSLAVRDLYPTLTDVRVITVDSGQQIDIPADAVVIDARELGFYTHAHTVRELSAAGCLPRE